MVQSLKRLLFGVLAVVLAAMPCRGEQSLMDRSCPPCAKLREILESTYPSASVTSAGLETGKFVRLDAELRDIEPTDILPGVIFADTSTIEELAKAMIGATQSAHGIDPNSLVKCQASYNGRGDWFSTDIVFRQCYNGLAVYQSFASFRVSGQRVSLRFYGLVQHPQCATIANLSLDSAIVLIEHAERNRVETGLHPRPVTSYGIVSTKLFDEFYDMRDSIGNWIPYAERVVGSELVIFADSSSTQIKPALSWHIGLSLGEKHERVPYFEAFVDARTGRLLWFESTGRGCIVDEWRPQSCAGSLPTQKEDISPSPLQHSE